MSDQPRQFPHRAESKWQEHPWDTKGRRLAIALLCLAPVFFADMADHVPPVGLAFGRWSLTFAILLLFVAPTLWRERGVIIAEAGRFLILGALGMGVCGVFVYVGADTTTATNPPDAPATLFSVASWVKLLHAPKQLVSH